MGKIAILAVDCRHEVEIQFNFSLHQDNARNNKTNISS